MPEPAGYAMTPVTVAPLERSAFDELAKAAFAVVPTGERGRFACFLVAKGLVATEPAG